MTHARSRSLQVAVLAASLWMGGGFAEADDRDSAPGGGDAPGTAAASA